MVGVNRYRVEEEKPIETLRIDRSAQDRQTQSCANCVKHAIMEMWSAASMRCGAWPDRARKLPAHRI